MVNFVLHNTTKIYFGDRQFENLGKEISACGKKVFIAFGGEPMKKIGLYDRVMSEMTRYGMEVFKIDDVEPNPRNTTVNKCVEICKREKVDVVLAVGGGSVIDCCKMIAAGSYYTGDDIWDLITDQSKITGALPLFTVCTLASTGSEMDSGCIINNDATHQKLSVNMHPLLFPRASFLDPTNTASVPAGQTAFGSIDIMSHLMDSTYFAAGERFYMSDRLMEGIFKTVVAYAPVAIADPGNMEARANLMWASAWGCNGFTKYGNPPAGAVHAMAHVLSAHYNTTHGLAIGLLLPRVMKYCLDEETAGIYRMFGVNVFDVDALLPEMEAAEETVKKMYGFVYCALGIPGTFDEARITTDQLDRMAEEACHNGSLRWLTKSLAIEDVKNVFQMCLE